IESAKTQSTIQILTADWICSAFVGKSPTMSPLFSDQKKASARYFHYPTTPLLRYTRSPLPLPVFLWRSAWGGCRLQERAPPRKEHATRVPLRRRAAANDRGSNARMGIRLGVRAIGNGQSVIKRTCPPSRDRRYC